MLLDTHFVIELIGLRLGGLGEPEPHPALVDLTNVNVSAVSLWEAAIKSRIGKLPLVRTVEKWPDMLGAASVPLLPITAAHILAEIGPEIRTHDPFDRLLLGVCAAENMQLVTMDRDMVKHPLAWRPFPR
ncbi:MAG: PIN domain-containing protein [Hyphomicrobiales bacterium]